MASASRGDAAGPDPKEVGVPLLADLLIGVAVPASLGFLLRETRRDRPAITPDGGGLLFRYGLAYRAFARLAAFGVPLAITACVLVWPPRDRAEVGSAFGLYAMFAALGLPLWWETTRFALVASNEGLDCRSPWRGRQFLRWAEVEEVAFSPINQWFIIKARHGRRFRVHVFVGGVGDLLGEFEAHLEPELLNRARAGYAQVGRDHHAPRD